jgi:hypothetical protein
MIEKLKQHPNDPFAWADDEAKLLCVELGIVNRFKDFNELRTQVVEFGEHPTHHILALRFSGQPDPSENGFQVTCVPKSKVSPAEFQEMTAKYNLGSQVIHRERFGGPPVNN